MCVGGRANCDVWPDFFANLGGALVPPTHFSPLSLIGTKSTYQGGLQRLCPPHHSAPWGDSACTTRVIHFKAAYFPSPTRTKGPESPVSSTYTPPSPPVPIPLPPPPPYSARGEREFAEGVGPQPPPPTTPVPPNPGRALRTRTRLGRPPEPLPGSRRRCRPPPCCGFANRTAGEGPSAGHSSASAALTESRGPNVRRDRTEGWLFWWGGTTSLLLL